MPSHYNLYTQHNNWIDILTYIGSSRTHQHNLSRSYECKEIAKLLLVTCSASRRRKLETKKFFHTLISRHWKGKTFFCCSVVCFTQVMPRDIYLTFCKSIVPAWVTYIYLSRAEQAKKLLRWCINYTLSSVCVEGDKWRNKLEKSFINYRLCELLWLLTYLHDDVCSLLFCEIFFRTLWNFCKWKIENFVKFIKNLLENSK